MANRNFFGQMECTEPNVVHMYIKLTAAADIETAHGSDPTTAYPITRGSKYVESVTRTGEGVCDIVLKDKFTDLLSIGVTTSTDVEAFPQLETDFATNNTFALQFESDAGAAVDPDSAVIYIKLELLNTGVSA